MAPYAIRPRPLRSADGLQTTPRVTARIIALAHATRGTSGHATAALNRSTRGDDELEHLEGRSTLGLA